MRRDTALWVSEQRNFERKPTMNKIDEVTLEIATPKGLFKGVFPKTATISEVIEQVVKTQGLYQGDVLELVYKGDVLKPIKNTLADFGFVGEVQLELVATGSGVCSW